MSETEAARFPKSFKRCVELVKPIKLDKGGASAKYWWRFYRYSPELYAAASTIKRVFVTSFLTKHLCFSAVTSEQVFSNRLAVVADDDWALFSILQSLIHEAWARQFSTTLKLDLTYTPSDCFDTFPFPVRNMRLRQIGEGCHNHRCQVMHDRQLGLTDLYNCFHDRGEQSADIARLRALHVEMDQTVAAAYGWSNLDLGHGFRATKQGERYTLSESARRTVLDRLLALNHQRYAEEVKAGLHDKGAKKPKKAKQTSAKPATERLLPSGFRFAVSDPATYAVNLVVALLSEASGSLPWQHLRDGFVFATRTDLMKQYAAPEDAQRVNAWAQRWNEKAVPKLLPTALKAMGRKNLFIQPQGDDFVFQLPDGPKPPASEDVGYDAWLALRVSMRLNGKPVPLPESEKWIEDVRQLVGAA